MILGQVVDATEEAVKDGLEMRENEDRKDAAEELDEALQEEE